MDTIKGDKSEISEMVYPKTHRKYDSTSNFPKSGEGVTKALITKYVFKIKFMNLAYE